MNILVTGGAGFIGSNLVHHLLNRKEIHKVVNLDKLTYAGNKNSLTDILDDDRHCFVQGDICDATLVATLLKEHSIDALMHLAAESHVDRSIDSPSDFITTNIIGTFTLLECARAYQPQKENFRFLHVSTDEVFGSLEKEDPKFTEESPYDPSSPYSATKASSDHLVRCYYSTYKLPVIITNCSNNYGPYHFPEKLIPLMIQKRLKGEPLPIYGDGSNIRDWLYVEDHCHGLYLALTKGTPGETYAIGGNCERTNLEVATELVTVLNTFLPQDDRVDPQEVITFVKDRPGHDKRYAVDCSKIQNELGWQPKESFASGLHKTIQWYLDNQAWVEEIYQHKYRGERLGAAARA